TVKGEKLTKISPHKLLSTTFTGKYPFEESSHTCEPAHPEANTMVIYQGPTSTFGEERVWDYEICEHNSSVKPTKDIPTSYSTQPLEEKKDKQKMFGIEDIESSSGPDMIDYQLAYEEVVKVTLQALAELLEVEDRKKKILDYVASVIAKVAHEKVEATNQVIKTTKEFNFFNFKKSRNQG
ncbi:hypothetical protein Tco_0059090, partial [Tanacetum coccineum]